MTIAPIGNKITPAYPTNALVCGTETGARRGEMSDLVGTAIIWHSLRPDGLPMGLGEL